MSNVAILIPTYKPKYYLERCLDSIQNQSVSKEFFKVYLVLNGSDLKYENYIKKILRNYQFEHQLFCLSEAGVSNARNFLIENSSEDFIIFLDDDDLISSNYLEELYLVTDLDFMGISNIVNFEDDLNSLKSNYIGVSFLKLDNIETSKLRSRRHYSSPVAKMLHRGMIGDVRFNTSLSIGEDSLFMAEISGKIKGVKKTNDDVFYYVCEREGSVTRTTVNKPKEIKRLAHLTYLYSKMLFSNNFDRQFIFSRLLATIKHSKKLL